MAGVRWQGIPEYTGAGKKITFKGFSSVGNGIKVKNTFIGDFSSGLRV